MVFGLGGAGSGGYAHLVRPSATEIAAALRLAPHPEGGFFRETYRAGHKVDAARGERPASTAILFMVTGSAVSRLHRLCSDELWVFQAGLPLELVTLDQAGAAKRHVLGGVEEPGLGDEAWSPQVLVPAGSWQGARLAGGPHLPASRAWALVTCIVSPGFLYDDFELGEREALLATYPEHADLVVDLT